MKKSTILKICIFLPFLFVNCGSNRKEAIKKEKIEKVSQDFNQDTYLKIIGTEPFWNIEIANNKIVYTPLDGERIEFPYNIPSLEKDSDVIIYQTVNGKGTIKIRLSNENCSDNMSDKKYNLKADIEIVQFKKLTKLKGCGYYFLNESLNGKWELQQIKSKKIPLNTITPFIDFDLDRNLISGNAGCNGLSASIAINNNELYFNEILLTRMFCEDLTLENNFVNILGQITNYKVNGNTLNLYNGKYLEMVFVKKVN